MLQKFKENKKAMEIKMEQARKIADAAATEMIEQTMSLVENASEEELKAFLNTDGIEEIDKIMVATMFAECHGGHVMMIGVERK